MNLTILILFITTGFLSVADSLDEPPRTLSKRQIHLDSFEDTLKRITNLYEKMRDDESERDLKVQDTFQEVENRLTSLDDQMRSFIKGGIFEVMEFTNLESNLESEFSQISKLFRELPSNSKKLAREVRFTKHMLDVMAQFSRHYMSAKSLNDPYHDILSTIYQIRILVMVMFNSTGSPDRDIKNFNEKVSRLTERLHRFGDENFNVLLAAPSGVIMTIWNQFRKAERGLEILSASSGTSRDAGEMM